MQLQVMENVTDVAVTCADQDVVGEQQVASESTALITPTSTSNIKCEVCGVKSSIYKCPGCFVMTCSCECVKKHKSQSGCNGQRNRAKYVAKSDFTEKNLRSDFHFLEDTLQLRTSAQRTAGKCFGGGMTRKISLNNTQDSPHTMEDILRATSGKSSGVQPSQSATKLVKGAKDHGVELSLMPVGMRKRKLNTSRYHKKVHVYMCCNFFHIHIVTLHDALGR